MAKYARRQMRTALTRRVRGGWLCASENLKHKNTSTDKIGRLDRMLAGVSSILRMKENSKAADIRYQTGGEHRWKIVQFIRVAHSAKVHKKMTFFCVAEEKKH